MEDKQEQIICLLEKLVARTESPQHDEEHQYIRLAMAREAKREKLYDAIIEKSIAGLAWAFLVAVGSSVWMYIKDHLK